LLHILLCHPFFYLLYTKLDPMTTADEELKAVEMTLKKCAE